MKWRLTLLFSLLAFALSAQDTPSLNAATINTQLMVGFVIGILAIIAVVLLLRKEDKK